jgi:F0F1-type ATP synthase membrane subunit b/b'
MAKKSSSDDDLVAEGREAFELCQDAEKHNRTTALDDIKFARLSEQWPDDIRKQREREGRPCLTINKLPAFIRQVVNDARQNKPSIHVHPVDSGADKKTADIISGLIRNIEYTSNADIAYDTAVECAVTGGVGYIRVGLDYAYDDAFDMDIQIKRVSNPFAIYGDPNSRLADSSDWDVAFVTDRLKKEQFERDYPDAEKVDWDASAWSGVANTDWINEDGVLVAEWWTREHYDRPIIILSDGKVYGKDQIESDPDVMALLNSGILQVKGERTAKACKVIQRIMSGLEVLKEEEWPGRYIPIVPVYGDEFDVEGKRYFRSLIHSAKDAQMMFNFWRTHSTELVALAPKVPFIGPKGAFSSDIDRWNTANTRSHAFLEYDPIGSAGGAPPQRQPLDMGVAAGALQEALNASDDIKAIVGMYDASLGQKSNETSGRAIMARQREGDVSTFHFIDNMARAIRHTGRILIDLIPKIYDAPRIIRVIGEDGTETARPVNQEAPEMDKKGQPVVDEMGEAIMAMHDLTSGKYDLTVKTGPSFTTRREEAAMQMTEVLRAMPDSAPIVAPILAKNLDWPGADEIAEKFEEMSANKVPPEVQKMMEEGKQQIQQLTQENQQLKMDTTVEAKKAETQAALQGQKQEADATLARQKAEADIQVAVMKAQADIQLAREKAMADIEMQRSKIHLDAGLAREKAASAGEGSDAAGGGKPDRSVDMFGKIAEHLSNSQLQQTKVLAGIIERANTPKRVMRGADGRIERIESE